MRVVNSESGYLWYVVDNKDKIVKVYLHRENAIEYIGDK